MGKVEVFQDRKKQWRFRVVARNGKIIAQSEGYTRKRNCLKGIESLEDTMFCAEVEFLD